MTRDEKHIAWVESGDFMANVADKLPHGTLADLTPVAATPARGYAALNRFTDTEKV